MYPKMVNFDVFNIEFLKISEPPVSYLRAINLPQLYGLHTLEDFGH